MVKRLKSCRNVDIVRGENCNVWGSVVCFLINSDFGHSSVIDISLITCLLLEDK